MKKNLILSNYLQLYDTKEPIEDDKVMELEKLIFTVTVTRPIGKPYGEMTEKEFMGVEEDLAESLMDGWGYPFDVNVTAELKGRRKCQKT